MEPIYLSIEPEKTGKKIKKLLDAKWVYRAGCAAPDGL